MSFDLLKSKAASDPALMDRLSAAASIQDVVSIAAELGISLDMKELETEELSLDQLSSASGGVRMMMASKLGIGGLGKGLGSLSDSAGSTDGCDTWDLDKCSTNTKDDNKACESK